LNYNNTIDIFTKDDLLNIGQQKKTDIIIRSQSIDRLDNIREIKGSLGIVNSTLTNLGNLKIIEGNFFISGESNLKSLENLETIEGDAILRYSNIEDLGNLKKVGGKLSLRDTNIKNLGRLEFIGGDLFLPKRLENNINLINIKVIGKIKYWNDVKTKEEDLIPKKLDYFEDIINIPIWEKKYIYNYSDIYNASIKQKEFYKIYKTNFFNNRFIDLKGNHNYSFILLFDILKNYNHNINKLETILEILVDNYPITRTYAHIELINIFEKNNNYEKVWSYNLKSNYISVETVLKYENILNRELINSDIILSLAGYNYLTEFGINNINSIKLLIEEQFVIYKSKIKKNFFEQFFEDELPIKTDVRVKINSSKNIFSFFKTSEYKTIKEYNPEYFKDFFLSIDEYEKYKSVDEFQTSSGYNNKKIPHLVNRAVINQLKLIVKQTEDLYREKIGMPKVGEGWISETELFYKISNHFENEKVVHHSSPKWLGRQHLDIYFPELNIAIEYQGEQHYKPINFFGGQEALEKTIERDERKKLLCDMNNCFLIYVYKDYDFNQVINTIITHENYTLIRK